MKDLLNIMVVSIAISVFLFCSLFLICLPYAYFDGSAKSAYLKQTQGIEIPWYRSTWLTVNASNINAVITHDNGMQRTNKSQTNIDN